MCQTSCAAFLGGKGLVHSQAGQGAGCILFLNGLRSLKPVAEVVWLCEDLKHLQLSDALTKLKAAAASSPTRPGRQTPAETELLKWLRKYPRHSDLTTPSHFPVIPESEKQLGL